MILADIINIIVRVFVKYLADWLTEQLLALFGITTAETTN